MISRTTKTVLGVMRGAEALYGVLLEQTEEGLVVRSSFPPALIPERDPGSTSSAPDGGLGMDGGASDVTIQFEDETGEETGEWAEEERAASASPSKDVRSALEALLRQCTHQGHENPHIAFCAPHSDVDQVEVQVPPADVRDDADAAFLPAPRTVLLDLLDEQYQAESGRVGFLPMSPADNGARRVLALISRPSGPIPAAIDSLSGGGLLESSPVQRLETEVSVYFGWARSILGAARGRSETSLLVRVGTDDTLLLFLEDNALKRLDTLPSLTIDDPPDTICSRVLLYQDEYGMGDVQNIWLMSEGDESELVDGFEPYFSKTNIQLLRDQLPYQAEEADRGLYLAAIGAAIRTFEGEEDVLDGPGMNLMGEEHSRMFWTPAIRWETALLFLVLFVGTSVGFAWYGMHNARDIRRSRAELQAFERRVARVDRDALQGRTDSLRAVVERQSQGRDGTEALLRGSNKWSRALADVTAQVGASGGIAVRNWTPQSATEVQITGHAATRPTIIELAQGIGGRIMSITFTDIRGRSLYAFSITVPLDTTKPAAVAYWDDKQAALAADEDTADGDGASSTSSSGASSSAAPDPDMTAGRGAPDERWAGAFAERPRGESFAFAYGSSLNVLLRGPPRVALLFW
jgi:hypothetical protein